MGKFVDLTGEVFGRLTVLGCIGRDKWGGALFECECSCFNKTVAIVRSIHLNSGNTKSCGCWNNEVRAYNSRHYSTKHGHAGLKTKEYNAWSQLVKRCTNKNDKDYPHYGGRGITVCERWLNSFENFLEDIGKAPDKEYSIDRINNNGNYELGNCRWATCIEQANNQRSNIMIGDQTLAQVCKEKDLPYASIYARINKLDWSIEDAITIPIGQKR